MARPNKIRQHRLEVPVRKMTAQGLTYRQIAERLKSEHNVEVGYVAVGRFINEETEERKEAVRSVAVKEAQIHLPQAAKAVTKVMQMGLKVAHLKYVGTGNVNEPKPETFPFAAAAKVVVASAKALHSITMGDDSADTKGLLGELQSILEAKRKREAAAQERDGEEDEEQSLTH